MKRKIVVINGTGGCGKDTFVSFCANNCNVYNFSSIDKVREIARMIGYDGGKTERDRKFLADLKALTKEYNDMPYNSIKDAIAVFNNSTDDVMFIHIREPEEIDRVVKDFDALSVLIKRKNYELIKSNTSDANVENYDYDYIFENDTLEKLEEDANNFISEILK